jgi:uncharacterized ubiquitin-like protein YukD
MKKRELKLLQLIEGSHATHLKITLSYNLGGINYFTYKNEERGVYLGITPVTIENKGTHTMESFMVFSGVKELVLDMKRFNQKKFDTLTVDGETEKRLTDYVLQKNNLQLKPTETIMLVTNVKYDTDGEKVDLPSTLEIKIPVDLDEEEIDEFVSDKISELTGFCHKGFSMDKK